MTLPTGWSPGSRSIAEMGKLYLGTSAVRVFFAPGEGLPASAWTDATRVGRQRLVDLPAGCTVVVSFKDQHVDRLAFVQAWLKYRPDVDLWLITHHEPEQQEGGDPTPTQYRASWTRTREQVGDHPARAEGRLQLAVCWTLQWIRRGGDWRIWWPDHEADAVDLVLGDWYPYTPGAANPYRPPAYEDPAAALKVMVDLAAATGKDWGIAEADHPRILRANGYTVDLDPTGELCATWYRQMHATARRLGCRLWCHFHNDMGAALGDLTKRPAEQAALRDLITQEANDVGAKRRLNWIADGSPFRLMTPARDLRDILRGHGYTVYDIGNRSHLEADPPEDHTPFSATGFPGKAKYGVGYALDVMPPKDGQRSKVDGLPLPSLQQLGAQLLADRKAGVAGIKWLKYMNWEPERNNGGPCYHESWQPSYARRSSTDRGHIHLSGLTGYETSTIGAGYDPVARIRGDDEMANFTDAHAATLNQLAKLLPDLAAQTAYTDGRMEAMAHGRTEVRKDLRGGGQPMWLVQAVLAVRDGLAQVDGKVGAQLADDFARIEAAVAAAGEADALRDADHAAKLGELAELVRAGQSGQLAADEVLRRMGEVLTAGTAPAS
ncbi:hypothetical protein ABZX66_28110 [Micromonospora aurantiaca]|uniref:hypothetical protein n=1 Tax=Micromonospora aurantiaca (nom. illeg.) TaxID=47850 RepID=UPI0033B026E3